jgi:limonene-1,2-epoxide hydrolase
MTLQQGYNIVTDPIADTPSEITALEFFRAVAADDTVETPVTVTGLEDLLYNATEDSRTEIVRELRQVLRKTRSIRSMDAVQFHLDGTIVTDNAFRVRIERSEGGIYLNIGQLFVEEPKPLTATHAVARK